MSSVHYLLHSIRKSSDSYLPSLLFLASYESRLSQITEDIVKEYDPKHFADDISTLLEATKRKNKCTDDEFKGLIASFITSLKSVSNSTGVIVNNFLELKGRKLEDNIILSLLIRRHFYPALTETNLRFEVAEFPIDIRWITALFAHSIEVMLEKSGNLEKAQSIGRLYLTFISKYPFETGEDLMFDIIHTLLIDTYYEKMCRAFKERIEFLQLKLKGKTVQAREEFVKSLEGKQVQGATEQILSAIEKPLYETLELKKNFDETTREKMEKGIEIVLKRMAIKEYGVQDIADEGRYMHYLQETWFHIFEEYPQMIIPLIDIYNYSSFIRNPKGYIEENRETIIKQLQFKIRRHTGGKRLTPGILAYTFSKLLFEIVNNASVRSLRF